MKVITPITMTDGKLTSTNMTENDHSVWVAADYVVGDYVISTTTHTIYRCIVAHLTAAPVDPDVETAALADPLIEDPTTTYWQVIGATNIWKLFDEKPNDICTNSNTITARITPGEIVRGLGVFGVVGTEITVKMTDPTVLGFTADATTTTADDTTQTADATTGGTGVVVYNETFAMTDETVVIDWWTWAFEPITQLGEYVITDLPPYSSAYIDVTITNTGDTAECGQIVVGPVMSIGNTVRDGSGWSILDYSTVEVDVYGNLSAITRSATRLSDFVVEYDTGVNLSIDNKLRSLRGGKPSVWVGSDDNSKAAQNYGILIDAKNFYQEGDITMMNVKIQGLV